MAATEVNNVKTAIAPTKGRDFKKRMDEPLHSGPLPQAGNHPKTLCYYLIKFLSYVTVEPTMAFYMMAFMITTVVEQSFFVYKACKVNHGYNETVCTHINEEQYENITKKVQITVSNFHLWNDIAGHAGQIILAFFMGAWSDRRGRKIPLIMGLIGKFYYSTMVVVNSIQTHWPVEYIIYTATLPMAFTGADVAIFAAAFTYLIDISSNKNRTLRVTLLEVCYLATMPIGTALGAWIYKKVDSSYTIMFIINASLLAIAIVYSLVRLEWRTTTTQRPVSEAQNLFLDFFDYNHAINTAKTLTKSRPKKKQTVLLLLIAIMAVYVFQRDERNMMYLYCQLVFNWTLQQYSNFRIFQSTLQDVGLLVSVPVMSRLLGWRDSIIIMLGAMAHSVARIFYSVAAAPWVFYIGGAFAAFGPIVAPVVRSMVSKMVEPSEKGKVLSVLAVADNAIPIISGVLYSQLYNATIHTHPEGIYYLTMASQVLVFLFALYIHFATNRRDETKGRGQEDGIDDNLDDDQGANDET
ncbi:probable peptidoglycan muropeptide transporter SLC46 [Euwallacea similis]|uniref:probable peptidoglycan muropeptide transporter SLC46 n=1 Tax=Euwallacea similis TaxID=1736056 RepID=UPI003450A27C